ncbi:uncharacterized protein BO97DRAFT_355293 [Aspergillus homomorphus CBS 101889]|uniref:Alkyl hydroperoxide reductase subunit C/ Thiol specific antioxidant domain-containing protein n=1 Tax=Aspergillus homomorphus (strain CBS 101889) TaxID=1450537 RepID=A0A395HK99_ASPHC|nr:hypothetical protein BO97DRAFT_355293 [Aspergillus homomorphus CBS 101889]RAL07939.1 hypothetical protein BO97DRAFT_355293 [Aspergillus homomorphus CBS 101889]
MSLRQELSSWLAPAPVKVSTPPQIDRPAPSCPELSLPATNGKPTIILFLRHCGCPVAESDFCNLRTAATQHPDINFIAVSHSDEPSTVKWLDAVGGRGESGPNPVQLIVDVERKLYARWGSGVTPWSHVLSPTGLMNIVKLGREKGIWNRPTESGSRWQAGGFWAVDAQGLVRWGRPAQRADDMMDLHQAVRAVRQG